MLRFKLKVIYITKSWRSDNVENKIFCKLPNYSSIHQTRNSSNNDSSGLEQISRCANIYSKT